MQWTDIYDIAIELEEKYPDVEIYSLSFTKLKAMVKSLNGFDDSKSESSEKILEAIQATWVEERE